MMEAGELAIGRARKPLLAGVNFCLPSGECWAIMGRNGSGKSTLLATLAGILPPLGGSVSVLGRPLRAWRRSELARHLGYLPQPAPLVFPYTIEEFVRLARIPWGGRGMEAATDALEKLQLGPIRGRALTALSGGELQRACIAHLFAQTTGVLLLDEPMAHLDLLHQLQLLRLLRASAAEGRAVALVTHDPAVVWPYCDRLLILGPGGMRLVARSDHEAVCSALEWAYGVEFVVTQHGPCLRANVEAESARKEML